MQKNISVLPIGKRVSKWGEGPIYWNNLLLYVDIEGHALVQLEPETGDEKVWDLGERIGTVVPWKESKFLCAGDSGIYSFDLITKRKVTLADPEARKRPDNRFNDGKCDPSGRFWTGTISTKKKTGDANLYMLDHKGRLSLKIPSVTNSNGICWNSAATVMYYIDSPTKKIMAYSFNNFQGSIEKPTVVIDLNKIDLGGSPDGMTIDNEDKLWVAICHGGVVIRVNPEDGNILQHIDFPCVETTACWFGGVNLERLFVTTGIHKSQPEPHAGKVFVVDGLGVRGLSSVPYKG